MGTRVPTPEEIRAWPATLDVPTALWTWCTRIPRGAAGALRCTGPASTVLPMGLDLHARHEDDGVLNAAVLRPQRVGELIEQSRRAATWDTEVGPAAAIRPAPNHSNDEGVRRTGVTTSSPRSPGCTTR
jgi:hypothetical protein